MGWPKIGASMSHRQAQTRANSAHHSRQKFGGKFDAEHDGGSNCKAQAQDFVGAQKIASVSGVLI